MSTNLALWKRVSVTDPKAVKPITGKQYQGNSPKPYWIVERLTDEFGPCGIGWGFNIVSERIERFSETDSLHIAVVRLWYVFEGKRGELEQIGQTKASYTTSKGSFMVDEDAPKKSVTDALVKCASYLGFAGDIFSGRWDDSKYVQAAAAEWDERRQRDAEPDDARQARETWEKRCTELDEIALVMIDAHQQERDMQAASIWYDAATWSADVGDRAEEQKYIWNCLGKFSKLRAFIKANKPELQPRPAAA